MSVILNLFLNSAAVKGKELERTKQTKSRRKGEAI
jgi:hypothetical protein